MTAARIVLLLGAGAVAGIVGSAGGTASLISYPALLAAGIPPLAANVTNAVAFVAAWPGSALGSQPELRGQGTMAAALGAHRRSGQRRRRRTAAFHPRRNLRPGRAVPARLRRARPAPAAKDLCMASPASAPAASRRLLLPGGLIADIGLRRLLGRRGGRHDPRPAHDHHRAGTYRGPTRSRTCCSASPT